MVDAIPVVHLKAKGEKGTGTAKILRVP